FPIGSEQRIAWIDQARDGGEDRRTCPQTKTSTIRNCSGERAACGGMDPAVDTAASTGDFLVRDRPELFRQGFTFLALVDYECVVFAESGPRTVWHFVEIYKGPIGHVCFL